MPGRTTREVFERHLDNRVNDRLEQDLEENYAEDVVLLTLNSTLRGKEAVRISADRLGAQLPGARFTFEARKVEGPYAFLVWRARTDTHRVECGADSFLVRDGRIVLQTIHYRLLHADGRECPVQDSPGLDRLGEAERETVLAAARAENARARAERR